MTSLPDPRHYGARGAPDRLLELTRASLATGDPIARSVHNDVLIGAIRTLYDAGEDAAVANALAAAASADEYRALSQRAGEATETPLAAGEIGARLFALPLAIVAGGRAGATLFGALPDADAVSAMLAEHAALGDVQRFSLGNALCGVERLDAVPSGELARASVDELSRLAGFFEPDPILLPTADESVHLRFLVGVAWVSSASRRWISSRDPVGPWATPLTHLLARQLALPDVTVLPLARPPVPFALAAGLGRAAVAELGFQLFAGGALRRARASIGEPTVTVSAHRVESGNASVVGEIRITFSSVFDDTLCDVWRWPLGREDDLGAIGDSILGFLSECRVGDVVVVAEVVTAEAAGGSGRSH